jgi:hypothetical protein
MSLIAFSPLSTRRASAPGTAPGAEFSEVAPGTLNASCRVPEARVQRVKTAQAELDRIKADRAAIEQAEARAS